MKLVDDWKRVLAVSISFWAQVLGFFLLIVPELVYQLWMIDLDPRFFWLSGLIALVVGIGGRIITQTNNPVVEIIRLFALALLTLSLAFLISQDSYAATSDEEALDIAVPLIGRWEGLRLNAYLDIVGVPTICYGSTRGVKLGMSMTKSQCDRLLREEVAEYRHGWLMYVNGRAYERWLPPARDAAYTSLAYNVGIRASGKSTATRRLNRGNINGGCHAIGWWNKAGGRVIRGLVNRRKSETALCLQT